jgi:hypothetical protein
LPNIKKTRRKRAPLDRASMGRELWKIAHDLDTTFASAIVIAKALAAQAADDDFEISRCVQSQIIDEIDQVMQRVVSLSRRVGTQPYVRSRPA